MAKSTCTSCGGVFVAEQPCPARGDGWHTRRRPALPRDEAHSVRVTVWMTPDEVARLDKLAKRQRATRAEVVRRAVEVAVKAK